MKSERSGLALIQNAAIVADQVKSVRPAAISGLDLIIEAIDHCGKLDAELAYASSGDRGAFRLVLGTRKKNLVANIALHLPDVGGMGLKNVDGVEIDLALVLLR